MKKIKLTAAIFLLFWLSLSSTWGLSNDSPTLEHNYLLGSGRADITGPALGVQMWGFSREDQLTEGIHLRLKSRAFIIAEPNSNNRLVFVSADIGSIEHNMVLEILDQLSAAYGDTYTLQNVIISATHTHAGPGGYWHSRIDQGLATVFYQQHFNSIVSGIVDSIKLAHQSLQPGSVLINSGEVEGAGINRSLVAYQQNPSVERQKYSSSIDKKMTLLKFISQDDDIGMLNWFSVHPTSMTYYNRLISGDHKGYAAQAFEQRQKGDRFVAAFAQSAPGDVTSNLNLNNTGPGIDDFSSTKIIGDRQLEVALSLFAGANERLSGKIDHRQLYVDLSNYEVRDEFTGAGQQTTCPSAYGYSFAGGSTEDGGGHFLFREGMTEQNFFFDLLIGWITGTKAPSQSALACQRPKPILWDTGSGTPPIQSQIRSISILRVGQLVILVLPTETTTMTARRLKHTVMQQLGGWAKYIVIAGYANGFAGYLTTPQEYKIQQYEGGHTLHGQWSLPAYRQISAQLAQHLEENRPLKQQIVYDDWRGKTKSKALKSMSPSVLPQGVEYGDALTLEKKLYRKREIVSIKFWSSNPTENYPASASYASILYKQGDKRVEVASDADWSTKIRWQKEEEGFLAKISWQIPQDTQAGEYKFTHTGKFTNENGKQVPFSGDSNTFRIQ